MYSYEDRIRAVRLYIKLGKRIAATIRRLGYPTKNSLKSWHREYVQCHDLQTGYVRSRPKYSSEQKKVAVEHYLSHDRCAAETLRALGYPCRGTLAAWIDELDPGASKRIVGKAGNTPKPQEMKQAAVIDLCTREESAPLFRRVPNESSKLLGMASARGHYPERSKLHSCHRGRSVHGRLACRRS